jgi:hypothetical protein
VFAHECIPDIGERSAVRPGRRRHRILNPLT